MGIALTRAQLGELFVGKANPTKAGALAAMSFRPCLPLSTGRKTHLRRTRRFANSGGYKTASI